MPQLRSLPLLFALLVGTAAAQSGGESGLVLYSTALQADPGQGAVLAELPSGTPVSVHGRQGMWLLVTAAVAGADTRGWARMTAVRFSGGPASPSASSGLAGFSRSLTGLLGGMRTRQPSTANATIGIRGLTPQELATAHFDAAALARVNAAMANREQAAAFASAGGLVSRPLSAAPPAAGVGR